MNRGGLLLAVVAAATVFALRVTAGTMAWQLRADGSLPLAAPAVVDGEIAAEVDVSGYSVAAQSFHSELRSMLSADGSVNLTYEALVAIGAVPGAVTPPKAFGTNVALGETVPEPSSAILILVGFAALALRRRSYIREG